MSAYEQAIAERNNAQAELERIEQEIQRQQHKYKELEQNPMATATSQHDTEQERNRLAVNLTTLTSERDRWVKERDNAARAVQREQESLEHKQRGEDVHREQTPGHRDY